MIRVLTLLFLLSICVVSNAQNENINLLPDINYPLWLKTDQSRTDQTSGITFIKNECDKKYFLLADDIGSINLLILNGDSIFSIERILFANSSDQFFSEFPKKDFEEIVYDENTGDVYLSVEGNGVNFNDFVGDVYKRQILC